MVGISHRLVKVILSTGEVGVQMINLDNSLTISGLAEIYCLGWAMETAFKGFKKHQILGAFGRRSASGYSKHAVPQDIGCNLLFYNLQTIAVLEPTKEVERISGKRKISLPKTKEGKIKVIKSTEI